ncbi:hypothetical protein [Dyella sp. AtDHG13]|uniref:hypothetical protein n=1 Tax=Dyella sp. AtDHG13 TaxID=1938897 RepID=UPI0011B704D5|nr:hypothetical protein [Dyella sp. AtDHG13]
MTATWARSLVAAARLKSNSQEQRHLALLQLSDAKPPALNPSEEEFELLTRAGDNTASRVSLCLNLRNRFESDVVSLEGANLDSLTISQWFALNQLDPDSLKVMSSCKKAAEDLARLAELEPSFDETHEKPVVLKRIPPPEDAAP